MDIKEQLLVEISKINTNYIASYIKNDPKLFKELMTYVFEGERPLPLRAAWVASVITDEYPEMLTPYLDKLFAELKNFSHSGVRRMFLRYLATITIPEQYQGLLFDDCYTWLLSKDEPPAVKVHSMQILLNISRNEPDLLRELKLVLEELTNHDSAGIQSRAKYLVEYINQLLNPGQKQTKKRK
jgi:hypothetical protein